MLRMRVAFLVDRLKNCNISTPSRVQIFAGHGRVERRDRGGTKAHQPVQEDEAVADPGDTDRNRRNRSAGMVGPAWAPDIAKTRILVADLDQLGGGDVAEIVAHAVLQRIADRG